MTTVLFGEPFDAGLEEAERHLRSADLVAAQGVYERLLAGAQAPFLRAHLLTNLGMVRLERSDLAGSAAGHEQAIALLRDLLASTLEPFERQLCLDDLLKALTGQADLHRKTGNLDTAGACLDEAATWLPEFEGDGTRAAELGNARAALLMSRGEWGAAEDVAAATLSTTLSATPEAVTTVPYLLTTLGLIGASTGRFDLAEDYFAQAQDILGEEPQLIAHRGYVAMRSGDLDEASKLYAEASAIFEQRRQAGDLAICEQARGFIAALRGKPAEAGELMATSLARFERHGMANAAADTMLLASQQAYRRGDIAEMQRLSVQAREVFEAHGLYERCAQADYLTASSIDEGLSRSAYGEHEASAIDSALALALPAALALEAARYDFATSHARAQWLALADEAMRLVFRLATRRQDQGLLFELVEFRCAGAPLARRESLVDTIFPDPAMKIHDWGDGTTMPGGPVAGVAAAEGLRVGLPPKVLMWPGSDRTALQEYIVEAESRYHRRIVGDETVESW